MPFCCMDQSMFARRLAWPSGYETLSPVGATMHACTRVGAGGVLGLGGDCDLLHVFVVERVGGAYGTEEGVR